MCVCVHIYMHTYIFDVLCFSKGKFSHFDNIVQKASAPISTTNGKTSQSSSTLSIYPGTLPVSALLPLSSVHFRMLGAELLTDLRRISSE